MRPNAVSRMLELLGDEWSLLIVQQALLGATRYADYKGRLPISNSVLTGRLRSLVREELLERSAYQSNPPRAQYTTTPRSRALWPVLVSIWAWERAWVPDHSEELPAMRHAVCGATFAPEVTCRCCGQVADEKDVVAQWGPSGSWPRSVPAVPTRRRAQSGHRAAGLFPQTMSVLGNRWGFALLVASFVGMSRFGDFQARLGPPPGSLADRLATFTANGILAAGRDGYRLTEKGRALFAVLVLALQWAQQWYPDAEGPAVVLTHTACGTPFFGVLACGECAGALRGADIDMV